MDAEGFTKIYSCNVFETCSPLRFHKDGKRVYMETNKGRRPRPDHAGAASIRETGKIDPVESDPLKRVDFGSAIFSEVTDEWSSPPTTTIASASTFKDQALKATTAG